MFNYKLKERVIISKEVSKWKNRTATVVARYYYRNRKDYPFYTVSIDKSNIMVDVAEFDLHKMVDTE